MTPDQRLTADRESAEDTADATSETEHFKPIGTMFLLGCFVATLILLWVSVYLILIDRGVTV